MLNDFFLSFNVQKEVNDIPFVTTKSKMSNNNFIFIVKQIQAKAIKSALEVRYGISTFVCDAQNGDDMKSKIVRAISGCKLAIILATSTYGEVTSSTYSTYQEMDYIFSHKVPRFVVKMCPRYLSEDTSFTISPSIKYHEWMPTGLARSQPPADLIDAIVQKYNSVKDLPPRDGGSELVPA
jgi:hypothetical protein